MTIRLLIAGAVAGIGLGAFACTGMYAGKKVSEDVGSIARAAVKYGIIHTLWQKKTSRRWTP